MLIRQSPLSFFNFTEETGVTRDFYLITPVFTLGFGPAVYLFVRQLTYAEFPSYRSLALHFLPMLLALPLIYWPQLVIVLGSISQVCYLAAAVELVRRYHRAAYASRSDAPQLRLDWLTVLLGLLVAMMLQDLVRLNLQPYAPVALLQGWYFVNTAIYLFLTANLLYLAMDVGFGAKSTFNSAFKKETGLTPSLYQQRRIASKPA